MLFYAPPDWGCSGEHAHWRRLLDRMTVGRVELPDGPIYVPEDSDTTMQAPDWASSVSIVDGTLNPVPLCDLDQALLKEVVAENRDLKNRSHEHASVTLTGHESPEDWDTPTTHVTKPHVEDSNDRLSEIAGTIAPTNPSVVHMKHGAFLAQLLLEEVDLESDGECLSSNALLVYHMRSARNVPARKVEGRPKPSPNNMPLSELDTQRLVAMLYE